MRTRTTTAAALTAASLLLALTGCSSDDPKPTPTKTVTVTATPTLSKAEITQQCADAVQDRAAATDGAEVPFEPTPEPCAPLTESEYLDAYADGIVQANEAARNAM